MSQIIKYWGTLFNVEGCCLAQRSLTLIVHVLPIQRFCFSDISYSPRKEVNAGCVGIGQMSVDVFMRNFNLCYGLMEVISCEFA